MKQIIFFILFIIATIFPAFSQVDTTSSLEILYKQAHDKTQKNKPRKFGYSIFGGLGKSGNDKTSGIAFGGSARAHYGLQTINIYASQVNRLEYHGAESESSTLHASHYGLTYGVGYYDKNTSFSVGAGLAYSFVQMSTGGGVNYHEYNYEKYGVCIGGQFSAHGKYIGGGIQGYYNVTKPGNNYIFLIGLEITIW